MVGRIVTVRGENDEAVNVEIMGEILVPLEVKKHEVYDFRSDDTTIVAVTRYLVIKQDSIEIFPIDPLDIIKFI